jgi:hypothetical protein
MREPLWRPASARLIAGLDRQLSRVKRNGHDLLVPGKVAPTDIGDLPFVAAMHEPFFTRVRNSV